MSSLRKLPFPPKALNFFKESVVSSKTYLKADAKIIFLCGKKPNKDNPTSRDYIFQYAEKHLTKFKFFLAEEFFDNFSTADSFDLLTIEEKLTDYSDCIIIVLESESAFTELGAFTISDELVKNILVINDKKFENNESFISLGPIAKLNLKSKFKPVIHTDLKSILSVMPELSNRLKKIENVYAKHLNISDYNGFINLNPKQRMLLILDIITLFHPLTYKEIILILIELFGENDFSKIIVEIGMLHALRLIKKYDGYYLRTTIDQKLFYNYHGISEVILRSQIINHFHKYSKIRVTALLEKL